MRTKDDSTRISDIGQRGAALVTVVMISILLLTASVAMLTAVGANSRNTTDVLSETKAYYAAESGVQATVNVLRNDSTVDYSYAVLNPTLAAKLTYTAFNGISQVRVGSEAGYSIFITDPDNTAVSTTYTTVGGLAPATGTAFVASRTYGTSPNTTTISYSGISTPTTITFPAGAQSLGSFQVTNTGTGSAITNTRFQIDYAMSSPRAAVISIGGLLSTSGTNIIANFDATSYTILGGTVAITGLSGTQRTLSLPTAENVPVATEIDANITPVLPYRLKVVSTGYGPNGSVKKLEAIIQKNLFNGLASGAATSMIGAPCPVGQVCFAPGTSNGVTYNGCSTLGCVPSFGLTDPQNLAYVIAHPPAGDPSQMQPPPALLSPTQLPEWQSSPQALDVLIDQLRTTAQNSGRYFVSPGGNLMDPGNFTAGTGITFCEGSCQVGGSGGGILVVTGKLTNLGGFNFKGMIIVTGQEGWLRNGGGNGQVIGNVVIAPYNLMNYVPENLSSTFLPPIYQITGGGGSDIIYGDVTATFDNTSSISDFVAGVAEK